MSKKIFIRPNIRQNIFIFLAVSFWMPASFAQLPPTNMGKFVHQPGDNQYSVGTQAERHGGTYFDTNGGPHVMLGPAQGSAPPAPSFRLAPPPPKGPDPSIEPIAAEEPVEPSGFPPMPRGLDLPVQPSLASGGSWRSNGGSGGGGGGNGGGPPAFSGMHQHYGHYEPGAFKPRKNNSNSGNSEGGQSSSSDYSSNASPNGGAVPLCDTSGYNPMSASDPPAKVTTLSPATPVSQNKIVSGGSGGGGNYYKCRTPPPIMRQETFATTTTGGTGRQANFAATPVASRAPATSAGSPSMGKAPALDDDAGIGGSAPEVPAAAGVFQSTSADLSLPDDEHTSTYMKDGKGKRYLKQQLKRGKVMGKQMLRQSGIPISF